MAFDASRSGNNQPDTGYRVELPRACDTIGTVLRDAYDRDLNLPEDMASLLRRMNGRTSASCD